VSPAAAVFQMLARVADVAVKIFASAGSATAAEHSTAYFINLIIKRNSTLTDESYVLDHNNLNYGYVLLRYWKRATIISAQSLKVATLNFHEAR